MNVADTLSTSKICGDYDDVCFIQSFVNGTSIRGCLHEYAAERNLSIEFLSEIEQNTYRICYTALCNGVEIISDDKSNTTAEQMPEDNQQGEIPEGNNEQQNSTSEETQNAQQETENKTISEDIPIGQNPDGDTNVAKVPENNHPELPQGKRKDTNKNTNRNKNVWRPGFEDRFCYDCDSTKNPDCVANGESVPLKTCPLVGEDHLGCYHKIKGKITHVFGIISEYPRTNVDETLQNIAK